GAGGARSSGRPELTAERFLPDPLLGEPGERLYRTGDRGRWRADGTLELLGRVDAQLKIRGVRIEPGEVEAELLGVQGVREAAVVAREDTAGERRLVAYLVATPGEALPPAAELRARLRERLPEHLVPAALVALDALPRTPNGKLDRRALPAPEPVDTAEAYLAPRTPVEAALAAIWAEVLAVEAVGVHDDFFALGGHSLLATRVVSRVRDGVGAELPVRALFEAPTVEQLAARVEALRGAGASAGAPPLVRIPRDGALPLSFAQQRLWFIHQLEPESTAYNLPSALRIRGALDVPALEHALGEVVRRHETLRTTFSAVAGRAVQAIHPSAPLALPVVELRDRPPAEREAELRRRLEAEETTPFDLACGPLLRVQLLRLGEAEWALLLTLHHIVSDGWSAEVMVREVSALYDARLRGAASPLPELPVQYADYAAWQRAWLQGETLERQLAWWRERLAGAPPTLELPTDHPRPRVPGTAGGSRELALSPESALALRSLARRAGTTLFMTLLAGWQALLARWSGEEEVCVGTPIAGRNRTEVEGLIGFFVNTLVIRTDLSGRPDARELLRRVRETTLGAYQHQELPIEKLVEELATGRSLSHTPLFQAMFAFRTREGAGPRLGGATVEGIDTSGATTKFDLSLGMVDGGEGLAGALSFRSDLFDPTTAGRLLEHFTLLLQGMATTPEVPVAELPLLAPGERERVLVEWNASGGEAPRDRCVHELFAEQAARTPGAPALVCRGETLTYAELERRANRLANHLRRRGVGPERCVGVSLERTPELVTALLAVLKAGGAYVPLDPAYPRARLA
ncbi:MAG TPA: condensation domain-containing protein, partial [Longimicrobiaceae bacterium]|nr:condensation domain-containing protein [Longimicrobiaceae bacterium]